MHSNFGIMLPSHDVNVLSSNYVSYVTSSGSFRKLRQHQHTHVSSTVPNVCLLANVENSVSGFNLINRAGCGCLESLKSDY